MTTSPPKRARPAPATGFTLRRAKSAFAKTRAEFYEDLAESLEDKAVLFLELEKKMWRHAAKRSPQANLLSLWLRRMDTMTFSNALKGTVPPMDSLVLLSAEASGNLVQGLRFLTFSVRAINKIKSAILSALVMPIVVLNMIVGMLFGFAKYMIPILTAIVQPERWPIIGKVMHSMSMFVYDYVGLIYGGFAGLMFVVGWLLPNWYGPSRKKFEKMLPFSIYRDYNSAILLISMSGLMESGASLVGSLRSLRKSSTPWLSWHIGQILYRLDRQSATPAKAFDTGVLPEQLYERVVDYGERSGFQTALAKIGRQALDKLDQVVSGRAKVVNQLMLAMTGLLMALIIGSVMLTAQQARQELSAQASSR